jgi:hypothetical protein
LTGGVYIFKLKILLDKLFQWLLNNCWETLHYNINPILSSLDETDGIVTHLIIKASNYLFNPNNTDEVIYIRYGSKTSTKKPDYSSQPKGFKAVVNIPYLIRNTFFIPL